MPTFRTPQVFGVSGYITKTCLLDSPRLLLPNLEATNVSAKSAGLSIQVAFTRPTLTEKFPPKKVDALFFLAVLSSRVRIAELP